MLDRYLLEPAARLSAALVPVIMVLVLVGVVAGVLRLDPLLPLGAEWPVLGSAITQNSVVDAQWHLYAASVLLALPALTARNGNVRVDFLHERLGARARAWVDLAGHLLFALPFLALTLPASWRFAEAARRSAERSLDGGLTDRYLVKWLLPIALGLLALVVLREIGRSARAALRGEPSPPR